MAQDALSLGRIALESDFYSTDAKSEGFELDWWNTGTDSDVQELVAAEQGDKSTKKCRGRRKRRRKNVVNNEDEAMLRRRRLIAMVLSMCPLVLASISLAVVMTNESSSNDIVDATTTNAFEVADVAPLSSDAPTFTPSVKLISEMTLLTTIQPSPHPTTAPTSLTPSSSAETHGGGIRTTTSPTITPWPKFTTPYPTSTPTSTPTSYPTSTPTSYPSKSPSKSPSNSPTSTPSVSTSAPSSGPPTNSPTDYCVGAGIACPNKKLALCCSDTCVKNRKTGERVCAPISWDGWSH